jgi:hypothetical protein
MIKSKNLEMYMRVLAQARLMGKKGITIPELRWTIQTLESEDHDRIWYGYVRPMMNRGYLKRHDFHMRKLHGDKDKLTTGTGHAGTIYTITLKGRFFLWRNPLKRLS